MDKSQETYEEIEALGGIDYLLENSADSIDDDTDIAKGLDAYGLDNCDVYGFDDGGDSFLIADVARKIKALQLKDEMEIRLYRDAVQKSVLRDIAQFSCVDVANCTGEYDHSEAQARYSVNTGRIVEVWRAVRGSSSKEYV